MNKTSEVNIDEVKETADNSTFIGEVKQGFLTEAQMQTQAGIGWVLCDGRDVSGSAYETITGNSAIPDLRGQFLRGLDNMRGVDVGRAMGSDQDEDFKSHTHSVPSALAGGGGAQPGPINAGGGLTPHFSTQPEGGAETRPTNVAINFFIRIN